ncbi:MAPEG family protein [Spongiibacter taiwanensis]|uniref:MAPEG family protein n=1 Tax=Spongiibacter taiwanensis TaxID=1748242 RepID=UPI002034F4FF|nr:MAPEG family protein [Spongiibacter taiwanensis]USA41661.1 MAPEG family protein [Spongiibacter taiwanensis]
MNPISPMLTPVFILVLWSIVVLFWMASARLPAIKKARLGPTAGERTAELATQLDRRVQFKADNYNHLMEQPTLFYAMAVAMAVAGLDQGLNLYLAWFYVASRIVHSIIQCTSNVVMVRFSVFLVGTLALLVMGVNGLLATL